MKWNGVVRNVDILKGGSDPGSERQTPHVREPQTRRISEAVNVAP